MYMKVCTPTAFATTNAATTLSPKRSGLAVIAVVV